MSEQPIDPFADLEDQAALAPAATRQALLKATKRGYTPLRNGLVQKHEPDEPGGSRGAVLGQLVHERLERPLDALMMLHAMQPILDEDDPLPMSAWAQLLSTRTSCSPNAASKAFSVLVELGLATRRQTGTTQIIEPLLEDGSGGSWTRAGIDPDDRYFVVPDAYWTDGLACKLRLPGKAMLLIILKETQDPKSLTFAMAVERAMSWYGVSERTAERGYGELSQAGVLRTKIQKVADPRAPGGLRKIYHRALVEPFGTHDRVRLQAAARAAATRDAGNATSEPVAAGTFGRRLDGSSRPTS